MIDEFEKMLEDLAGRCRGRMMTEEEWQRCNDHWVTIGLALAPCRPPKDKND